MLDLLNGLKRREEYIIDLLLEECLILRRIELILVIAEWKDLIFIEGRRRGIEQAVGLDVGTQEINETTVPVGVQVIATHHRLELKSTKHYIPPYLAVLWQRSRQSHYKSR